MPFFTAGAFPSSPDFFFALHLASMGLLTFVHLVQGRVGEPGCAACEVVNILLTVAADVRRLSAQ